MLLPIVMTWVKQRRDTPCIWINPCDVRSFVIVARETGESQVLSPGRTTVLTRNDMVNLKGKRIEILRHTAIFTASTSPLPHLLYEALISHGIRCWMIRS
jgi:hypothetical protein